MAISTSYFSLFCLEIKDPDLSSQTYNNINLQELNFEWLDLPVLENRGKINIYNDISCRATASDVPEIIISTKQLLRNFVRIPARKMS